MPPLAANAVFSTAVTDLINALVLVPMVLHMLRFLPQDRPDSRFWLRFMSLIAAGSFLGFVLHICPWERWPLISLWVVLYVCLLEALHQFLSLAIYTAFGGDRPRIRETHLLRTAEFALLSALIVFLLLGKNPIRLFLVFGVFMALAALGFFVHTAVRRKHKGCRTLLTALLPQIPGLVLQFMRRDGMMLAGLDFNGLYHICILASVFILYIAARRWHR